MTCAEYIGSLLREPTFYAVSNIVVFLAMLVTISFGRVIFIIHEFVAENSYIISIRKMTLYSYGRAELL